MLFCLPSSLLVTWIAAQEAEKPSVTFFVASDSHFGARGMSELNRALVQQMNELPGTETRR